LRLQDRSHNAPNRLPRHAPTQAILRATRPKSSTTPQVFAPRLCKNATPTELLCSEAQVVLNAAKGEDENAAPTNASKALAAIENAETNAQYWREQEWLGEKRLWYGTGWIRRMLPNGALEHGAWGVRCFPELAAIAGKGPRSRGEGSGSTCRRWLRPPCCISTATRSSGLRSAACLSRRRRWTELLMRTYGPGFERCERW
jgi:hypothetical protein